MEIELDKFNVRVYGLITDDNDRILVSDEVIRGHYFTKFPGGGLELGESPRDCLARECREEMDADVEVVSHYYTTDMFVRSAFRKNEQVISIYYKAKLLSDIKARMSAKIFDFDPLKTGDQEVFRWVPLSALNPDDFQFLIDAEVVRKIKLEL
jgi:ADP-ribose pyrophosphatase YjhB (NUDIX family)